jgi:TRAP-type mannitol/chloroaromatic compound transport system permease small subunit
MQKWNPEQAHAAGKEPTMLRASNRLRRAVESVGQLGSWLIIPLTLVTVVDVVARKLTFHMADGTVFSLQLWLKAHVTAYFESTLMQELEWHLHTALFALVLGLGTIYNAHVRVDLVRERLDFRKKAWIEFLGTSCFMIPYLLVVIYFATSWVADSYAVGEISASQVGLSHRWIIKGVLVAGLVVAAVAGFAVWLQLAYLLCASRAKRFALMTLDWPDEAGLRTEGKERIRLEDEPLNSAHRRFGNAVEPAE